jgi:hypothetical protein
MGEQGSAKTSTVLHSGLEPELLSGVTHQDVTVAPTRTANVWLAKNTVFVEPGASLLVEQSRWVRLVRRLRPGSLKSAIGGNAHAPRAAVVCVNAEMFTQQGSADYFAHVSKNTHARLGDIAQTLGISFPVYVRPKSDQLTAPANLPPSLDRTATTTTIEGPPAAEIIANWNLARNATISPDYASGQDVTKAFVEHIKKIKPDTEIEVLFREDGQTLFLIDFKLLNAPDAKGDKAPKNGKMDGGKSKPADATDAPKAGAEDATDGPGAKKQ